MAKLSQQAACFSVNLLRQLNPECKDNAFFSPASISMAMGMVVAGAAGDTKTEIVNALFNGIDEPELHDLMSSFIELMVTPKDAYALRTANRLYSKIGYKIKDNFIDTLAKQYRSDFKTVNFDNEPVVRKEINDWVEEQTNNKIKDLIPEGCLDSLTRLVIVNAIYFKGSWMEKFDVENTQEREFFVAKNKPVTTQMMHLTKDFPFSFEEDCAVLHLPYVGDDLVFGVILPHEVDGLPNLMKSLTGERLLELMSKPQKGGDVMVSLPKFKLESTFQLKDAFTKMGASKMFIDSVADLTRIVSPSELFVSAIVHKAFVEVNEEGTEAAAATGVVMMIESFTMPQEFTADHPFLFSIWHSALKVPLFTGVFAKPPLC